MKTVQLHKTERTDWEYLTPEMPLHQPLVLVFGNRFLLEQSDIYDEVRALFPTGQLVFGSSCGEIVAEAVHDQHITITAIEFEKSRFDVQRINMADCKNSEDAGQQLAKKLVSKHLKHVFVISEGSSVNGSALTKGIQNTLPQISMTGALCGDDGRFERTLTSYNEAPKEGEVVIIGFYGDSFEVSYSIYGGWKPFGPERFITKSEGNVLYEIDGKPALDLYKRYLGDKAKDLPSSALIYPLNVKTKGNNQSYVRTILNIDESNQTMILAGDVPEESTVQLMMSSIDGIAAASETAAIRAMQGRQKAPELALLISCIGRKLVLDQRVEEEVEEVREVIGDQVTISGFYSYGEMAPFYGERSCKLHNQTMTITLISE